MTSNLFIFFQKTDIASIVVLLGVVVVILVAVIVSTISNDQDEKGKDELDVLQKETPIIINEVDSLFEIIEYFMFKLPNAFYFFEDNSSTKFVQFAELFGNGKYTVDICIPNEDKTSLNNARNCFKEFEIDDYDDSLIFFRKEISNKPKEGVLFLFISFFEVFELDKVQFILKTHMKENFKNSKYNIDDLKFEFDKSHYNEMKDEISQFKSTYSNPKQTLPKKRSRRITQEVKDKVWNRDGGKCVECGSNENLEFDHIIPHSKGGANTYRNIQLLCEPCNRSKSAKIG